MKRNIILLVVGVLMGSALVTINLMAETISNTGMSQRALVAFLTNVVTLGNEVKSDHNAVFAHYTGLRRCLINYTSASTLANQISNRTLPTGPTTSTSNLSLSGL